MNQCTCCTIEDLCINEIQSQFCKEVVLSFISNLLLLRHDWRVSFSIYDAFSGLDYPLYPEPPVNSEYLSFLCLHKTHVGQLEKWVKLTEYEAVSYYFRTCNHSLQPTQNF